MGVQSRLRKPVILDGNALYTHRSWHVISRGSPSYDPFYFGRRAYTLRFKGQNPAGWANNLFIDVARQNGALGAKLTGAGSGGSVFALMRRGEEEKVTSAWLAEAKKAGLDSAQIFTPHMDKTGLRIDEL